MHPFRHDASGKSDSTSFGQTKGGLGRSRKYSEAHTVAGRQSRGGGGREGGPALRPCIGVTIKEVGQSAADTVREYERELKTKAAAKTCLPTRLRAEPITRRGWSRLQFFVCVAYTRR